MEKEKGSKGLIILDDNYAIAVAQIGYALVETKTTKKGEAYNKPVAYYNTVYQCLLEFAKQSVHDALRVDSDISLREALELAGGALQRSVEAVRGACPAIHIYDESLGADRGEII